MNTRADKIENSLYQEEKRERWEREHFGKMCACGEWFFENELTRIGSELLCKECQQIKKEQES
jgi:hypothetical protein